MGLILRLMEDEDPRERGREFREHLYLLKDRCKKTKQMWSLSLRPYGFWTFERHNAQMTSSRIMLMLLPPHNWLVSNAFFMQLDVHQHGGATRAGGQKWEDQIVVLGGVAEAMAMGGLGCSLEIVGQRIE
ncbi:UNVERIFIED_CONTAM: hypothetical protein Slati_1853400 [Sesamum latifolium]|uniref:Uncharacterized protein n=1 Tax=Sesamum latifolium TaxID=2727402 RepID=A0AAW2X4P2_9LAMI